MSTVFLCRRDASKHRKDDPGVVAGSRQASLGVFSLILCTDTATLAGRLIAPTQSFPSPERLIRPEVGRIPHECICANSDRIRCCGKTTKQRPLEGLQGAIPCKNAVDESLIR